MNLAGEEKKFKEWTLECSYIYRSWDDEEQQKKKNWVKVPGNQGHKPGEWISWKPNESSVSIKKWSARPNGAERSIQLRTGKWPLDLEITWALLTSEMFK